jgi:thiol-disulfide isomerase/thioredoxin
MGIVSAALITASVIAVATLAGLVWRARSGRVAESSARTTSELSGLLGFVTDPERRQPGLAATLLQFSSEHCATCAPTRRVLSEIATNHSGVTHLDIDLTPHPELARRLNIMQTPTTIIFDGNGKPRGRIGGAPRIPDLLRALEPILEAAHVRN